MKKKIIIDPTALENLKFEVLADLYSPDYLYNPDKTKLVCKALPHTTLVSKRKSNAPGYKFPKECVLVFNCANSTGRHKILCC